MFFFTENVVQNVSDTIVASTSTTSTSFSDLLTVNINSFGGSYFFINFTASGTVSTDNNGLRFQLLINGVAVRGCGCGGNRNLGGNPGISTALVYKTDQMNAGQQTIKIQWCLSAAGTGTITPINSVTNPPQHGQLTVLEILA